MQPDNQHKFTVTAGRGIIPLLAKELTGMGIKKLRESPGSVQFTGTLADAYRVCLWSRLANRVLMAIGHFDATTTDALYEGIKAIPWENHIKDNESTLAVEFNSFRSKITHTQYGAQRVKDGIVDRFREHTGGRPSVDLHQPDLRINVYVRHNHATVSIDLSGESLHKRGYRIDNTVAPLKENLAATILNAADWQNIAQSGGGLLDPMCGSGTLLIEAALIAADIAPGLSRDYFGFSFWQQHDKESWQQLLAEAQRRRRSGLSRLPKIMGGDSNLVAVDAAQANIAEAGLSDHITVVHREMQAWTDADGLPAHGLVVSNPPYGERIGRDTDLPALYTSLGRLIREQLTAWRMTLITDDAALAKYTQCQQLSTMPIDNGPIACHIINYYAPRRHKVSETPISPNKENNTASQIDLIPLSEMSEGANMFANRLAKNLKHSGKWARKNKLECYRVYDADLPEYAVAVDIYGEHVHVQEYAPPKSIDPEKAIQRLDEVMMVIPQILDLPTSNVVLKLRQRQRGTQQYEAHAKQKQRIKISEQGHDFWVNLTDYLDTGLFLDHRITRQKIAALAPAKDFLNLFAYTGSATVYAAAAAAKSTTTIDMSNTYLEWAQDNMRLNGLEGASHQVVRANCIEWLDLAQQEKQRYGLIFLDPPTFSNSSRMEGVFDIQRDHVAMIKLASQLLTQDGTLIFSTNRRDFKMDSEALTKLSINDISHATLPEDFKRNPKIHYCWEIKR